MNLVELRVGAAARVCMWAAGFNRGLGTLSTSCTIGPLGSLVGRRGAFPIPARVEVSLLL